MADRPVDTIPFRIDQIQLAATRGALDFELGFDGSGVARPLVPLDVIGVSFEDVNRFRDEEQVADERISTITSGSFGLGLGSRPPHTLQRGKRCRCTVSRERFEMSRSTLRPWTSPSRAPSIPCPPAIRQRSRASCRSSGRNIPWHRPVADCVYLALLRAGRTLLEEGYAMRVRSRCDDSAHRRRSPLAAQRGVADAGSGSQPGGADSGLVGTGSG